MCQACERKRHSVVTMASFLRISFGSAAREAMPTPAAAPTEAMNVRREIMLALRKDPTPGQLAEEGNHERHERHEKKRRTRADGRSRLLQPPLVLLPLFSCLSCLS